MNFDREASVSDDCFVTALQIFDFCGVESGGTLQVDALMEKLVPPQTMKGDNDSLWTDESSTDNRYHCLQHDLLNKNTCRIIKWLQVTGGDRAEIEYRGLDNFSIITYPIKTNKVSYDSPRAEYSYLKSLLDPTESNPEINVEKLAWALNKYSDTQKIKEDYDESFNSKNGPAPLDSDSGISADAGFQFIEELQSQLREKSHLARQLRGQLDFADRQHEDAIATLQAERDSLRAHLNMVREENASLSRIRENYDEEVEHVCALEKQLLDARIDVDALKKLNKALRAQIEELENEKSALSSQLSVSVSECHRMNELYLTRQSTLREDNELLRARHADLLAKLRDQDHYMQQLIKDKVILEMELKEMFNKQNHSALRLDRSIDVSYTEDQMLSTLDPLAADSQFSMENKILDEESFICALKEDQGRATNMSLFDEIRYSLSNASRHTVEFDEKGDNSDNLDNSLVTVATQTDELSDDTNCRSCDNCSYIKQSVEIQAIPPNIDKNVANAETQTDELKCPDSDNNNCGDCNKCLQCERLHSHNNKLENDLRRSNSLTRSLQTDLDGYEKNLTMLQKFLDEGNVRNTILQTIVNGLQSKIGVLETVVAGQRDSVDKMERLSCDTCNAECQTYWDQSTVSTQADAPCVGCEERKAVVPQRGIKKYLLDPLRCLFQIFAVVCFAMSVCVLYGVTRRWGGGAGGGARCAPGALPWSWLDTNDLMDLLLRIEYVGDVPL